MSLKDEFAGTDYTKVTSPHIRQKIAQTSFEDRAVIDDLVALERYIRKGPQGMAGNMQFNHLKRSYRADYVALAAEVGGEAETRARAEVAAWQKDEADARSAHDARLKAERASWKRAGGR